MRQAHGIDEIARALAEAVDEVLRACPRALVAIVGKNGTGKSYLGRELRKRGLGRYAPRELAVIDDGTLYARRWALFTRRIKIPTTCVDELAPFLNRLRPHQRVLLYINATPARRITRADVLLRLSADEETRRARLAGRYGPGTEKFMKYFGREEPLDPGIRYAYRIEGET